MTSGVSSVSSRRVLLNEGPQHPRRLASLSNALSSFSSFTAHIFRNPHSFSPLHNQNSTYYHHFLCQASMISPPSSCSPIFLLFSVASSTPSSPTACISLLHPLGRAVCKALSPFVPGRWGVLFFGPPFFLPYRNFTSSTCSPPFSPDLLHQVHSQALSFFFLSRTLAFYQLSIISPSTTNTTSTQRYVSRSWFASSFCRWLFSLSGQAIGRTLQLLERTPIPTLDIFPSFLTNSSCPAVTDPDIFHHGPKRFQRKAYLGAELVRGDGSTELCSPSGRSTSSLPQSELDIED